MKKVLAFLLVPAQIVFFSTAVWALEAPQFPSCTTPSGTIIASYQDGTHGVPGDGTTYTGSDTVYQLNADLLVQCLCPPDTSGIQTDWWKIQEISEEDLKIYTRSGWVYVPNGALWGLDEAPYLARNSRYSCNESGRGGVVTSSTSSSSSDSSSNNDTLSGIGGAVLGVSTLAGTGSTLQILFFLLSGMSLLFIARRLKLSSKK